MIHIPSLLAAVPILALAVPATSQFKSTISPPEVANVYTGAHNGIPFGGYQSQEQLYQQVDAGLLNQSRILTGIAFSHSWSADYGARAYDLDFSIGDAGTTPATISDTFTLNFASTPTMVFSGTLNWPVRSRGFTLPGPFDSAIPFKAPWTYTGKAPICWETYIRKDSGYVSGTADHFFLCGYASSTARPKYWAGSIGRGCLRPGANPLVDRPLTSYGYINSSTGKYVDYVTYGPANATAILKLGLDNSTWLGIPLPFPLAFLGKPQCDLNIAPLIDGYLGQTDTSGRAELSLNFTLDATTTGLRFRSQWVTLDGSGNLAAVSNGLQLVAPLDGTNKTWPVSRNWGTTFGTTIPQKSTGRPVGSNGSRSGNNEPFYGLIAEYRHL